MNHDHQTQLNDYYSWKLENIRQNTQLLESMYSKGELVAFCKEQFPKHMQPYSGSLKEQYAWTLSVGFENGRLS